jgi:hypothetical protein
MQLVSGITLTRTDVMKRRKRGPNGPAYLATLCVEKQRVSIRQEAVDHSVRTIGVRRRFQIERKMRSPSDNSFDAGGRPTPAGEMSARCWTCPGYFTVYDVANMA